MRKIFLLIASALLLVSMANAQDCYSIFPKKKGATMLKKTYDGKNKLMSTMFYTVVDNNDKESFLDYVISNADGVELNKGTISTSCNKGKVYVKMLSLFWPPEALYLLNEKLELIGDYLDFPNIDGDDLSLDNLSMDEANFIIYTREDKDDYVNISLVNRYVIGRSKVSTPAGEFDALKIGFVIDVYNHLTRTTVRYKGNEWYTPKAGIIRTELFDANKKLLSYTLLTEINE